MNPINKSFSDDLTNILKYIETTLVNEFPSKNIVSEYFIVGVLENKNCLAYAALEDCLMTEIIKSIVDEYSYYLSQNPTPLNQFDIPRFSENFNEYIIQANVERVKHNHEKVNTLHMILSMLFLDGKIKEMFGKVGLTYDMFESYIMNNNLVEENETKPKQLPAKVNKNISSSQILKTRKIQKNTLIETYSQNLNELASKGKIDKIVGREKEIGQMFNILGRRNKNNLILVGNGGVGKCLGKGTKILMYDGTFKNVENINIGDKLMGVDSTPRTVLDLGHGYDNMYRIKQTNGNDYRVNSEHILSLKCTQQYGKKWYNKGDIVNLSIKEYLSLNKTKKSKLMGWKPSIIEFNKQIDLPIDAYFLGLWLGDGDKAYSSITNIDNEIIDYIYDFAKSYGYNVTKNGITYDINHGKGYSILDKDTNIEYQSIKEFCKLNFIPEKYFNESYVKNHTTRLKINIEKINGKDNKILNVLRDLDVINNKHIPFIYKTSSAENRLKLLAGLIDSDGNLTHDKKGYEITQKIENIIDDIIYIAHSLGIKTGKKRIKTINGISYYRIHLYGPILNHLPLKLNRKRVTPSTPNKDILCSGVEVIEDGFDEYFGFEIDGDKLFMLEDFTVTHNTAICRHLANLIVEKKAPVAYHKKKIVQMDISAMIAGANFRGMFEERLKGFLEEVKNDKNYIIFIDDIHNALSEKNQAGDVNVASMLNNILIDGDIQVIGTTNFKDYKNTIENNSSLSRRFQKIVIEPSSINESITILNGCKEYYETYHNVKYTDEAIKSCVLLANRYISDRNLPDSAIDLLDESASRVVLKIKDTPEITNVKEELLKIKGEKRQILSNETYEGISALNAKENTLKIKLSLLEKNNRYNTEQRTVYDNDVCELVSEKTSIPITKLSTTEKSSLKNINNILKSSIIGQDDAIDKICQVVKRNRIGLSNKNKPIVMFLGGPTGVGKTLIAKKLSKEVFGDEKYLVRLDMSEYAEKSSITKLIGSAPGYIGYDNGGQLTEIIKNKKYCVLLLDEIEKANQEIYNVFLQLFDEGCLTDNTGAKIDFKNVIILLTSNTGAKQVSDFGGGLGLVRNEQVNTKTIIQKELKKKFPPEFINRIDDIIYFNKLTDDNIKDIIRLELHNLDNRLVEVGFSLEEAFYQEEFINFLFDKIKDQSEYGARPVLRIIQETLENPITDLMLDMDDEEMNKDGLTMLKIETFMK